MTTPDPREEQPADATPAVARDERLPVGVIVERRKARNPWDDFVWRAVALVPGAVPQAPWSVMREEADATRFFAGTFVLELHPRDTALYRENLTGRAPSAYVVLVRDPAVDPHGIVVRHVTLSPGDAEAYSDAISAVDAVPIPDVVAAWLADYVAAFHVEEPFRKRKRKPHDPRKGFGRGSGSNDYGPSDE
jgi:hypothetical protein